MVGSWNENITKQRKNLNYRLVEFFRGFSLTSNRLLGKSTCYLSLSNVKYARCISRMEGVRRASLCGPLFPRQSSTLLCCRWTVWHDTVSPTSTRGGGGMAAPRGKGPGLQGLRVKASADQTVLYGGVHVPPWPVRRRSFWGSPSNSLCFGVSSSHTGYFCVNCSTAEVARARNNSKKTMVMRLAFSFFFLLIRHNYSLIFQYLFLRVSTSSNLLLTVLWLEVNHRNQFHGMAA